jgi:hypothetical protein
MIETIKNLANILFFAIVSIVTVLSYFHARKTLFAPIRTETFKLQLNAFQEVLLYFQNKSESDFLDASDLNRIVSLNVLEMADSYVSAFFQIKIDADKRKKDLEPLVGGIVSKEYLLKETFQIANASTPVVKPALEGKKITNPTLILANWQTYERGMVHFTKEYQDQVKELDRLAASPLLPKALREYIGEFRKVQFENLELVGKVVTECAKRMPDHFPNASDMQEFSATWVWNEFNCQRRHFEPLAKQILDYINNYLKVEEIMS